MGAAEGGGHSDSANEESVEPHSVCEVQDSVVEVTVEDDAADEANTAEG